MKKYMTISLLCFLFVAIAISGMEAKPLKAVNIECFIHMIKMCSDYDIICHLYVSNNVVVTAHFHPHD